MLLGSLQQCAGKPTTCFILLRGVIIMLEIKSHTASLCIWLGSVEKNPFDGNLFQQYFKKNLEITPTMPHAYPSLCCWCWELVQYYTQSILVICISWSWIKLLAHQVCFLWASSHAYTAIGVNSGGTSWKFTASRAVRTRGAGGATAPLVSDSEMGWGSSAESNRSQVLHDDDIIFSAF